MGREAPDGGRRLRSGAVGRREPGPCRKPKAWGGLERWWLVGVARVTDLLSWCRASPVQRVVVSDLLQCVGVGIATGAVGGRRRCVRWRQWLKVVKAEGVGPVEGKGGGVRQTTWETRHYSP
jgi:hypothetical protein